MPRLLVGGRRERRPLLVVGADSELEPGLGAAPGDEIADVGLMRDYHRVLEIHALVAAGGVSALRRRLERQSAPQHLDRLLEGMRQTFALDSERVAAMRSELQDAARTELARLDAIPPREETAVRRCGAAIEIALREPPATAISA